MKINKTQAFEIARKLAITRPQNLTQHHGCVILDKSSKVVSIGWNQRKTHPLQHRFNHRSDLLHAEIDALRKIKHKNPYKLFVVRVNKKGEYMYSKPCTYCQDAISSFNIKETYWSGKY